MGSAVATMAMANDILGFISIFPQGEDDALPGGADLGTGWNVGTAGQGDGGTVSRSGILEVASFTTTTYYIWFLRPNLEKDHASQQLFV